MYCANKLSEAVAPLNNLDYASLHSSMSNKIVLNHRTILYRGKLIL